MSDTLKCGPAIRLMMDYVHAVNKDHGWFDSDRTFGEDIALLHSEVSEALESYRKQGLSAHDDEQYDKDSVGAELADVLIRLLDTCSRYNIDLANEFFKKMKYNEQRPYRHGGKKL